MPRTKLKNRGVCASILSPATIIGWNVSLRHASLSQDLQVLKILNLHGLSYGEFLLRNAKQGTFRKIGGLRNTSRMTNYADVLAILSSVFEFVQEGNRYVYKLLEFVP